MKVLKIIYGRNGQECHGEYCINSTLKECIKYAEETKFQYPYKDSDVSFRIVDDDYDWDESLGCTPNAYEY